MDDDDDDQLQVSDENTEVLPPSPSPSVSDTYFLLKPDELDTDASLPRRHPQLWFEDGTVILSTPELLFKVYKGILSLNVTVFKEMFSLPQPADGVEMLDGIPVVHLQDDGDDLVHFLSAYHIVS